MTTSYKHDIKRGTHERQSKMSSDNQQNEFNFQIESRVGRLEGAVESLTHEVQETSQNVRHLVASMGEFKTEISRNIGEATAPKWPLIASIGSLITTIMLLGATLIAFIFSGQSERITELKESVEDLNKHKNEMMYDRGANAEWRLTINHQFENVEDKFDDMDISLQREMRLLNETINERVTALDEKLQHEFNGRLATNTNEISALKEWQLEHTAEASKIFGQLDCGGNDGTD